MLRTRIKYIYAKFSMTSQTSKLKDNRHISYQFTLEEDRKKIIRSAAYLLCRHSLNLSYPMKEKKTLGGKLSSVYMRK